MNARVLVHRQVLVTMAVLVGVGRASAAREVTAESRRLTLVRSGVEIGTAAQVLRGTVVATSADHLLLLVANRPVLVRVPAGTTVGVGARVQASGAPSPGGALDADELIVRRPRQGVPLSWAVDGPAHPGDYPAALRLDASRWPRRNVA
jgi:hypothetical protein